MVTLEVEKELEQSRKHFTKEDHYFKVDRRILEIQRGDIGKAELLLYLQHCRAINPKKNLQCSFIGKKNTAKKNLGLHPNKIDKTEKMLIEKHFIRLRDDVKTGVLKTTPIEVLQFPEYIPSKKKKDVKFYPSKETKNQHRKYKNGSYITIPSTLIDKGALKELSLQAIFALIHLYDNINWLDYWGVDYEFVSVDDYFDGYSKISVFGDGFNMTLYGKDAYEVGTPQNVSINKDFRFINGNFSNAVHEIVEKGIYSLIPILFSIDNDDNDIRSMKKEIFRGACSGHKDRWVFSLLEENNCTYRIMWILRPSNDYILCTPDYEEYERNRNKSLDSAEKLYSTYHYETDTSKHKKQINDLDFWYWLKKEYEMTYITANDFCRLNIIELIDQMGFLEDEILNSLLDRIIKKSELVHYNNYVQAFKN